MGEANDEKHKGRHKSEAAEFGQVKREEDLEDSEMDSANPDAKKDARRAFASPELTGYYERKGAELTGALNLEQDFDPARGQDLRDHARSVDIDAYERAYNMYSIPYGMTLKALGRTKDLSTAGAAMTPADLQKKQPKLAQRFAGLTNGREPQSAGPAFNDWSRVQKQLSTNVSVTNAAQVHLQAAIYGFKEAQAMIEQRKLAARKAADTAELNEINETAETLARVVDVSVAAVASAAEIETVLSESAPLDEAAEGVGDLKGIEQTNNTDLFNGTASDPTGANLRLEKTKTQKASGAASDAKDVAKTGGAIAKRVHQTVKETNGADFKLSLKDIFVIADGDGAKYSQLTKDIAHINQLSARWGDDQFKNAVKRAHTDLDAAVLDVHAKQRANRDDSLDARRKASDFATAIGGGEEGTLAMYAAEAYQELAAHGDAANDIRARLVDEPWSKVYRWLNNYPAAIQGTLAGRDAKTLANNVKQVGEQREFLQGSLPEWKERAAEWSDFFKRPLV